MPTSDTGGLTSSMETSLKSVVKNTECDMPSALLTFSGSAQLLWYQNMVKASRRFHSCLGFANKMQQNDRGAKMFNVLAKMS